MNAHHLKQYPELQQQREGPKMAMHELISNRLGLSPFKPLTDYPIVESAKAGRFHQSTCSLALYSNAFTQKAFFPADDAPFGYLNPVPDECFSFGVYKRHDGSLFGSIIPLSADMRALADFARQAVSELPIQGVYIRFLRFQDYIPLVSLFGFKPAKEEPWLPDAPEEDESLSHSKVDLSKLFRAGDPNPVFPPLRRNVKRAMNFMARTGMEYRFAPLTRNDIPLAKDIVRMHFDMVADRGKLVGSTYHDYLGLLHPDILSLKTVSAYLGILGNLPISVFITEGNGNSDGGPCVSGYAGITLRNVNFLYGSRTDASLMGAWYSSMAETDPDLLAGSSSIPTYAFAHLFSQCILRGYRFFYMGGSEHADIDTWKHKRMGAERDPTYWAVYTRP